MTTNETKFTPGPWEIHQGDDGQPIAGIRERADGRFVALTQFDAEDCRTVETANDRRAECAANAHLIAAAPDLYAAVRLAFDVIHAGHHHLEANCPDLLCRQMHAALAKAEGR